MQSLCDYAGETNRARAMRRTATLGLVENFCSRRAASGAWTSDPGATTIEIVAHETNGATRLSRAADR